MIPTVALPLAKRLWDDGVLRFMVSVALAAATFAFILLALGKDPASAYGAIFRGSLGDSYGWTEVLVKVTPFILCALAVVLPAQLGLLNVGGEGQFQIGALAATAVVLSVPDLSAAMLLPMVLVVGSAGGALWGGLAGALRARPGLNEAICTLLMNYVAIRIIDHFTHGPWKDPASFNWPFSPPFPDAARLPTFGDSRAHVGILLAALAVGLIYLLLAYTRWGYEMRVIGGNPEVARRAGLPLGRYLVVGMLLGGGMAGLAGAVEVAAIHGRLQPGIGVGYGYIGFLASWLASSRPLLIVPMAALLAVIAVGGEVMQISVQVPASSVNVLMALILFWVLGTRLIRLGGGPTHA